VAQAIVGLGNPGDDYRSTRHNVGQRVVELLARALHKRPARAGPALVARGEWQGEPLYLVKPLSFMNVSGPPVATVAGRLGLAPADLILVYDDIDLALGTVRVRMKGSHGGHRGVRSIIEALGTDEFRRVKVGVGRPPRRDQVTDHVLTRFTPEELPMIEAACEEAADRALALVAARALEGRR
jgi:peptidyl-tRNA hydrolase, PTH1 family